MNLRNVWRIVAALRIRPTRYEMASFAYDCTVNDALWAVYSASVPAFINEDRGTGTAQLKVVGNLAVKGSNGIILRANYIVFYKPS
jgi:hypothetical protein